MTSIELIDTSVKIGLGALIAAASGYVLARLGYSREAEKLYATARRSYLDKVIEILNSFHKTYPPVRSAMYRHVRRHLDGQVDTSADKAEFAQRREALILAFLTFTDAEGYLLAIDALEAHTKLFEYIDTVDSFRERARFENDEMSIEELDRLQGKMRESRLSVFKAISEAYRVDKFRIHETRTPNLKSSN